MVAVELHAMDGLLDLPSPSHSAIKRRDATKHAATIIFGVCGALVMLAAMHLVLITKYQQPGSTLDGATRTSVEQSFDPLQCQAPPLSCWDGYNKRGGVFCVNPKKPLPLRDGSAVLQPGSSSCYKAVYFNIERATYIMAAWFLFWFTLASRGLERLASCWLAGRLNTLAAAALLINQASIWYSTSVIIHYTNDYWFDFYWSQMYYTLTECYMYIVAMAMLSKDTKLPVGVVCAGLGMAVHHACQLLLDEGFGMVTSFYKFRRGTILLLTDSSYVVALVAAPAFQRWLQQVGQGPAALRVLAVAVGLAVVFYTLFADGASFWLPQ